MDKIYLGTNWKMHKNVLETKNYLRRLLSLTSEVDSNKIQLFVIPPYTSLWAAKEEIESSNLLLGAQNMHWKEEGAYTGEISPLMLEEIDIDIIELGHSERRQYYNESDEVLNKKVHTALKFGFNPLICIGEKEEQKNFDVSEEVVKKQLKTILHSVDVKDISKIWIAYEPVWAIGEKGKPAEPSYAEKIHYIIRKTLEELYNEKTAKEVPILYGGSVNLKNAYNFISRENVDGLFIGRAAWKADSFYKIIQHLEAKIF